MCLHYLRSYLRISSATPTHCTRTVYCGVAEAKKVQKGDALCADDDGVPAAL